MLDRLMRSFGGDPEAEAQARASRAMQPATTSVLDLAMRRLGGTDPSGGLSNAEILDKLTPGWRRQETIPDTISGGWADRLPPAYSGADPGIFRQKAVEPSANAIDPGFEVGRGSIQPSYLNDPRIRNVSDTGVPDDRFYARNQQWVRPGEHVYNTPLNPQQESAFRLWTAQNKVPFDTYAPVSDYDMRGFWKGLQSGDPMAAIAVNPNDNRIHYPDYWKTPYHQSFSEHSQWATPDAPRWLPDGKLVDSEGRVLFDEGSH